ncbi:hypothetical protein [Paraburkholderia flava]|uniref:hypothetical protein n=1 Tax=Paraburkholderia flava TaxID=2547393 RepID=UPI0010610C5A|nr:hypothetical protein [Paraburkholderia flava]
MKQTHRSNSGATCSTHRFSHPFHDDMSWLPRIPNFFAKSSDLEIASKRAGRLILIATIVWAFVELPFELLAAQNSSSAALLLLETVLSALVGLLTLHEVAWARLAFLFVCGTSIVVIASGLATEIRFFPVWSTLSLIELIAKIGSFVLVCRNRAGSA